MKKITSLIFLLPLLLTGCGNKEEHFHVFSDFESAGNESHERVCECGEKIVEAHVFDKGTTLSSPTHLLEGKVKYTCEVCGYSKEETLPKLEGHVFDQAVINDTTKKSSADCHNAAEYYLSCICGAISDTETFKYGNPLSHQFGTELKIEGTYKTSYYGGEEFDTSSLKVTAHCSLENVDVEISNDELEVTYQEGLAFKCGDTKVVLSLKNNKDIKKEFYVVVDHKGEWDKLSKTDDELRCEICDTQIAYFHKVLSSSEPQLLEVSGTNKSISLDGISNYSSVVSVKYNDISLGTNINSLDLSGLVNNYVKWGGNTQYLTVVVKDALDVEHTVSVPVKVITKSISTEEDLHGLCVGTETTGLVTLNGKQTLNGIYIQTQDITSKALLSTERTFGWNNVLSGIYEGNGHTITTTSGYLGIFSNLYNATVRNLNIIDTNYTGGLCSSIMSKAAENCTFENVDIKVTGHKSNYEVAISGSYGAFAYGKCYLSTFTNCHFDYTGLNLGALIGCAGGTFSNNFENCTLVCQTFKGISICTNDSTGNHDTLEHPGVVVTGTRV